MFDLEKWKQDWADNQSAWGSNARSSDYSERIAQRCRNVERLLLLDLVQHLGRQQTVSADFFDRPELAQLLEAARLVGG